MSHEVRNMNYYVFFFLNTHFHHFYLGIFICAQKNQRHCIPCSGFTGSCELFIMGARNQTGVLYMINMHS